MNCISTGCERNAAAPIFFFFCHDASVNTVILNLEWWHYLNGLLDNKEWLAQIWPRLTGEWLRYLNNLLGSESGSCLAKTDGNIAQISLNSGVRYVQERGALLAQFLVSRYISCPWQLMQCKEVVCRHTQNQQQGKPCLEGREKCSIPYLQKASRRIHTEVCRFQRKVLSSGTWYI